MQEKPGAMTASQKGSLISGVIALVLGLIYVVLTLLLPKAAVGLANAPKVFPMGLGVIMIILGAMLIVQQLALVKKQSPVEAKAKPVKNEKGEGSPHTREIILTVINGVFYALLFDTLGYVLATIVFLGCELLLFSGRARWKMILIVSVLFSMSIYILFNKLLGVYLPMMPLVGF